MLNLRPNRPNSSRLILPNPWALFTRCGVALLLALFILPASANAAWWDFGTSSQSKSKTNGKYNARIQRTSFGIPHINAKDWGSLGYGYGYAFAEDNLCVLARDIIVATGTQSRWFGGGGNNVPEDWVFAMVNSDARTQASWDRLDFSTQELLDGYAAGYNRYLRDTGLAGLDPDCRDQPWVRPIDAFDMLKVLAKLTQRAGTANFLLSIAGATPPAAVADHSPTEEPTLEKATQRSAEALVAQSDLPDFSVERFGSNAVALGKELTGGPGALLGNPHFPWFGIERFYAVHLTIPGRYDAMGASIYGFPLVSIGFNRDIAWSHTVSTARRFVLRELHLVPGNPTSYVYDGEEIAMTTEEVTIEVLLPNGLVVPSSHTFYKSQFGPIMILPPAANWSTTNAYALTDINLDNERGLPMYREIGQARSVSAIERALSRNLALPWVNTVAADRYGNALYADITTVPHVTDEKLAACANTFVAMALSGSRVYTLDGSTSDCDLGSDPDAVIPGIFGPSNLPKLKRKDYVQNSNNSYWLSNPSERLEGFPQIIGTDEGRSQGFRTRLGITQIRDRMAGLDDHPGSEFNAQWLGDALYGNRHYSGEIMRDGVLTLCAEEDPLVDSGEGSVVDVSNACAVLESWDGRNQIDSVGTHVWRELWSRMRRISNVYAVPFDENNPANTPRDVNLEDASARASIMVALAQTVEHYAELEIPLNAAWGDVHFDTRQDGSIIPIHGGSGGSGVYNAISVRSPVQGVGFTPILGGSSYIQTVDLTRRGPRARAIVTYSQSTNVESPHFSDMTELFSNKGWVDMPFRQSEIRKDPNYTSIRLIEKRD
ncbi:MAG: penicillin acylase family protein [Myxococcota bacterium]